ncbi:MAG: hypothetical protein QOK03_2033, partial [Candidatus Binataceae bacterium]|nr:hypothetical protein [Candidatus Binataceae bacterium]
EEFTRIRALKAGRARRYHGEFRGDVEARKHEGEIRPAIAERTGPRERVVIADDGNSEINVQLIGCQRISDDDKGIRIEIAHLGDNRVAARLVDVGTQVYLSNSRPHQISEQCFRIGIIRDEQNPRSEQALLRDTAKSIDDNLPAVTFNLAIGQRH